MRFCEKRQPPLTKNFSKGEKRWRFTNTSPFLWSSCWAYFADEIRGSLWLPIPFSIPLPASALPSSYGDQTMRPHFEMIDDLSFWNDIQIYFRLIKGETVVSKWCPYLFEMTDGFLFEMKIWLSFRYGTRDFSPSVYYRRDSHFSCHMKRIDFQRMKGAFVKTVFRFKLSKLYHFKKIGCLLRKSIDFDLEEIILI